MRLREACARSAKFDASVMPGAMPTTLTFGASAIASSLVASFNAAFESV